jgi:Amt family ammonium transporter
MTMTIEFWFLIGAALVFWMQAGFAMVETGFTRAKNAGNIIMKNLMDFCIGTVVFSLLGYSLMMGEDALFGLIGNPNLDLFTHFANFIRSPSEGFTGASLPARGPTGSFADGTRPLPVAHALVRAMFCTPQ